MKPVVDDKFRVRKNNMAIVADMLASVPSGLSHRNASQCEFSYDAIGTYSKLEANFNGAYPGFIKTNHVLNWNITKTMVILAESWFSNKRWAIKSGSAIIPPSDTRSVQCSANPGDTAIEMIRHHLECFSRLIHGHHLNVLGNTLRRAPFRSHGDVLEFQPT